MDGYYEYVVTRFSTRLKLEDCAWDCGAQEAWDTGKKTVVPVEQGVALLFVLHGMTLFIEFQGIALLFMFSICLNICLYYAM